ncbi:MAG: hypothetical protein DRR42_22910 [Gammaproteobacteria bacterium]|nr:MAG: hypothetical protein DRR42_22910 [Gammaproteobacteria bacterium]
MNKFVITLLLVIAPYANSAEISNFKAGIACTDAETFGWICHETVKVFVSGQGTCEYNKQEVPCTWHGFEFEYKDFTKDTVFECTSTSSKAADSGNPEEIVSKNTRTNTYRLDLAEGDGFFFNPQYRVLATPENEPLVVYEHTECFLDGVKQIEFNHEFVFPADINP